MALNPRVTNIKNVLTRTVPVPDNICCPVCRVGETLEGTPIYIHFLAQPGGEYVNLLISMLANIISTTPDATFSGNLPLYEEHLDPLISGLLEIGSFGSGSDLDNFVKMAEKLFYYSSPDIASFFNEVLGDGIVTFCIGEDKYVTNAQKAYALLNDKGRVVLDEESSCYIASISGE